MDISDDICRPDFFDLVPMGLDPKFGDPSTHGLMPVTLIDSADYMQPDGNNNLGASTGHIKSFLDEMFLVDPVTGGEPVQSIGTLNGASFEVLGTFQWNGNGSSEGGANVSSALGSSDEVHSVGDSSSWFLNPNFSSEGEVTTLTNLIDPLFVTYGDDHGSNGGVAAIGGDNDNVVLGDASVTVKIEPPDVVEHPVVSSDLISSTFLTGSPGDSTNEVVVSQSGSDSDLITWHKSSDDSTGNVSTATNIFCDESLLRSALQSGKTGNGIINGTKIVKLAVVASSVPPTNDMTELRTLLSFPPLTNSSASIKSDTPNQVSSDGCAPAYYELKVIDPMLTDDANIPNVEELIMTRIDPPFGNYQNQINTDRTKAIKRKLGEISERKINSTTLSTKWTYTTTNANQQGKAPRRRNKKNSANSNDMSNNEAKKTVNGVVENGSEAFSASSKSNNGVISSNEVGSPNSQPTSGSNNVNNGIRKERSLHYCNICCKGFKDKYSVNVHVRTHTGEKPFSCNLCGKNFRQKAHLAKHYQTHAAKANNQVNKANNAPVPVNNNPNSNSNSSSSEGSKR